MYTYTENENEILNDIESGNYKSVNYLEEELMLAKTAANNTTAKSKNINIRVTQSDITKLKAKSIEFGIPYQTMVNSLIHQFATNRIHITL